MGREPDVVHGRPCDLPGCAASTNPSMSLSPPSPETNKRRDRVRSIGMDVHRDVCEIAIAEAGDVRAAGRIESRVEAIELFAGSLAADDEVVLEATYGAAKIAKLIEPH